jgi:hypothetical protein
MPGWHNHLNEASTEENVVAVCNAFLAAWTFQELGQLPALCQPRTVIESKDVGPYAFRLIEKLGDRDAATAPTLHRMTTFFNKAARRLVEIGAPQA